MEVSLKRAAEILAKANNIIVTGHIYPDGDSLGSILALSEALASFNKKVQMYIDDDIPLVYHFLKGAENVQKPEGKVQADLLVVLDASDDERIGKVKSITDAPILNIDHHISNIKFADYWYLDTKAAATGEIIMALLNIMHAKITPDIAAALYTAIATDCGFFRYANTTANTMTQAARLIEHGAKPNIIAETLETKPLNTILALKEVLDSLEFYDDGKVATITLLPELIEATSTTEGFINYPRNIEGVEVAVMFKVVEEGSVRISMRSKEVDVSKIALQFGGGGHKRAAGCTMPGDIKAVKDQLLSAIHRHVNSGQMRFEQ
ncbi:MAG: bifunctional oligoribonuclease/PAP phosphatase NrnA [Pelosinus sp.]|nr:bifunctional oligoribonuclease/PAP phosphatase NrnA [Pelosinus sp.]